jgi:HAD superfamily hydrolase (TIGR01490 family)
MPRAALFDLDRTLVRKNTGSLYVRRQRRLGQATLADDLRVAFWMLQYTFGVVDAEAVAARALAKLAGQPEREMTTFCEGLFREDIAPHLAREARVAVERHRRAGDLLAIVTGASRYVATPVARALEIDHLVASELDVDAAGRFTGRFVAPLCYAQGKLARARALAERQGFRLEDASFYSDSISDLPLLEAVGEPVVVNPDPRLRRLASARGWRVERW